MSIHAIPRSSARRSASGLAASDSAPSNALAFAPPASAAAARVRTAPTGAREEAFGHLLNRLDESARFTAAAEAEATRRCWKTSWGRQPHRTVPRSPLGRRGLKPP